MVALGAVARIVSSPEPSEKEKKSDPALPLFRKACEVWEAISHLRMGERQKAKQIALELKEQFSAYPKLDVLLGAIDEEL